MSYWSNIQASWISRGWDWKNLWIPNYKRLYTWYFINDYVLSWYLKTKYFLDDKLNWTFMYYYDCAFFKTYDRTFMVLWKYNIDFARLNQVAFVGKLLTLKAIIPNLRDGNFYFMTTGPQSLINFSANSSIYYYFFLIWYMNNELNIYDLYPDENLKFRKYDRSLLQFLSASLFLTNYVFSTKMNFFDTDNFHELHYFNYWFYSFNISEKDSDTTNSYFVKQDRFWLANFLFNPTILSRYPNFILFYNHWVHKSWQMAKWNILNSLKLNESSYNLSFPVHQGINYFFSKYLRFVFAMWEVNTYITPLKENEMGPGIGITQEFIQKQIYLLHLKLSLWNTLVCWISDVWFYLKAYLWYFSWEGWVNLNWSRFLFVWLFEFWQLLWISCSGYNLSIGGMLGFLKTFYTYVFKRFYLVRFIWNSFRKPLFLRYWYLFVCKSFLRAIKYIKWIVMRRRINIFLKIWLLYFFTNFFTDKVFRKKRRVGVASPKLEFVGFDIFFPHTIINLNCLMVFFLSLFRFWLHRKKRKQVIRYSLVFKPSNFIIADRNCKITTQRGKRLGIYYTWYINVKWLVKYSNWITLVCFHPGLLVTFFHFTHVWRMVWKKNFIYFYFAISHLTPKLFFWIFSDLVNLPHFSMLIHLLTIYWQNFFFFYLFILKCLKKMYAGCSEERLLALSRPSWVFMQWSKSYITLIDLFSSSFWNYLALGLYCIDSNLQTVSQRAAFTLADFASKLAFFGKSNCYLQTLGNPLLILNKFSYTEQLTESPFFMPFLSFWISDKAYFKKNGWFFFEKKNWLDVHQPYFSGWVPTHLIIDHFSNLFLNATLIAVFVKKKLEWEHPLPEVLRSLTLLVGQTKIIKGFMFLLKGWFSRWERASKIWLKRGKLSQVSIWTRLDYCKVPVTLKYGSASVWIWLVLTNIFEDMWAAV